jgi:hypothetical protein
MKFYTSHLECCNDVESSGNPNAAALLGLLGIVVPSGTPIGINCSPVSVIGPNSW